MKESNLDKRITVRLTHAEYERLLSDAGEVKLSEFVRQKLLNQPIVRQNAPQATIVHRELSDKPKEVEPIVRTKHPTCEKHGHTPVQRGNLWLCALCGSKLKKREA